MHMVSFEKFVKSMTPSLLELKVTPSFCFTFKIPDNVTATNKYLLFFRNGRFYQNMEIEWRNWNERIYSRTAAIHLRQHLWFFLFFSLSIFCRSPQQIWQVWIEMNSLEGTHGFQVCLFVCMFDLEFFSDIQYLGSKTIYLFNGLLSLVVYPI